jgi:hypothetical protein
MVTRTDFAPTSKPRIPTEAESIIEAVQLLHALAYDAATIAKNLHIDQAAARHVIRTGMLPQRQLSLAWAEVPE